MNPVLSLYDRALYRKPYMPTGHNLQPLPWRPWGWHNQKHNFQTFQLRWTKWLYQTFDWKCLEKWRAWGEGAIALPLLSTIKTGTSLSILIEWAFFEVSTTTLSLRTLYAPQSEIATLVLRAVRSCHIQRYNFQNFQLRWTKWLYQNSHQKCFEKWSACKEAFALQLYINYQRGH